MSNKKTTQKTNKTTAIKYLPFILIGIALGFMVSELGGSEGDELAKLRAKVADNILLEDDEQAKVLDVKNIAEIKENNPFFKNAENGDRVLVFQNRVIIYRESSDLIINHAPYLGGEDFNPDNIELDLNEVSSQSVELNEGVTENE